MEGPWGTVCTGREGLSGTSSPALACLPVTHPQCRVQVPVSQVELGLVRDFVRRDVEVHQTPIDAFVSWLISVTRLVGISGWVTVR